MSAPSPVPSAPGLTDRAPTTSWSRRHRRVLLTLAIVAGLAAAAYVAALVFVGPEVPRGTTVGGVDIGGLRPSVAVERLDEELAPAATSVDVALAGEQHALSAADAGLALDSEATVTAAGERSLNPLTLFQQVLGQDVDPVVGVDDPRLQAALDRLAKDVDDPVRQGRVYYDGLTPVAVEPEPGVALDREVAAERIIEAYLVPGAVAELPVVEVTPEVTAEQVQQTASGPAVLAVSAPVTLDVARSGEVVVQPGTLAESLTFVPDGGQLVPRLKDKRLRDALSSQLEAVEQPAVDATFDVSSGRPRVVPSKTGFGLDDATIEQGVVAAMALPDDRTASVQRTRTEAELTTKEAKALGITEVVSSYNQYFPYAEYRVTNIGVAARNMNGTIIQPGETYSMNGVVGERTPENGFVEGYVIQGGRLVEDYGGAVSTITTATWHAAFFAGMTRIEQRAHSYWISRYTPGLEATVSWGSLDLKWRNDTPYGVLVTTSMTNESVTVTLWSTKYWDIEAQFGPRTDYRAAGVIYDASSECVAQEGVSGFDITVTRVWIRNGEVQRREPLKTSYDPAATVICRPEPEPKPTKSSTKSGSGKPTTTASGSPKPTPTG